MTNSKMRIKILHLEFLVIFLLVLVKIGCGSGGKKKERKLINLQETNKNSKVSRKEGCKFSLLEEIIPGN